MFVATAILLSLAGPLFWRDAAPSCDAAVDQLWTDLQPFASYGLTLAQFDCDDDRDPDPEAKRPYWRLVDARGNPVGGRWILFQLPPADEPSPDQD